VANDSTPVIRAAGGVVWRRRNGGLRIALVHRPKYDDWSLPKGKLDPGETRLAAAVREVGEELGATVAVSRHITRIHYDVSEGHKNVDFWVMRETGGRFRANAEVDDVRWLTPAEARSVLSYDVEREVIDAFESVPLPDATIVLVRHASAGKRAEWHGDDVDRPLDARGRKQAERLSAFLQYFAPDTVVSANPLRCVQTVEPLARDLGLEMEVDGTFSDAAYLRAPDVTLDAVTALAQPGRASVISSQGDTIPGLVKRLMPDVRSAATQKAAAWVLGFADRKVVSADYVAHAAR
jgi:8-oxo-dGTP pyrophosphatase MutT (NUDIX family)